VVDLNEPVKERLSNRHLRAARAALRQLTVEVCTRPGEWLEDWLACYQVLVERHHISGLSAFSRESFARQLAVPGAVLFRAAYKNATAGLLLWYEQGDVAIAHLGCYSELGYDLRAAFALFWRGIEHFTGRLRWIHLGAHAGATGPQHDGLTRFKRGWATGTRTTYLCGRVLQPERYAELSATAAPSDYFPRYRAGEFA
jgi:hypothetical protein